MPTLPQLIEEDVQQLDRILQELLVSSEATSALIIDKGGFLITYRGEGEQFDLTTIAALASGAYLANQTIANLVHENNFDSVYQQGEKFSMLVMNVDEHVLLTTIFRAAVGVGAVKYYAMSSSMRIAQQLVRAQERTPGGGLDLSVLNIADPSQFFRKQA
ncbi:roadblock/LC7 domain-containing protein [Pedosphaera parvula]|uniref:Roadblock/LC7 family protein n=1 Tax=Pedosphaera parvula (strain Ellin514) TaxID=320771 RepID=B9XCH6_PEDPL|nr:roadblock/LC7 domain-containing protein [Pedosphaera parvula]EEF62644.1 Roadblock/LC7 family protein [Pedosphaera parvula Ellin514]